MFRNRQEAGTLLARELEPLVTNDTVLMAIPRGGVVIGAAVAARFGLRLRVVIPRKIGAPGNEELAIGALAGKNSVFVDRDLQRSLGVSEDYLNAEVERQLREIARRSQLYGEAGETDVVKGKNTLIVDDGLATGSTAIAAALALREAGAKKLILAVPVSPVETARKLQRYVDDLVCLDYPSLFYAVGQFYEDFAQVSDGEVVELLERYSHDKNTGGA